MKEHPIIFSTPMVKAIQEGRKTQTRRVIKKEVLINLPLLGKSDLATWCPYGQVGDRLWVRETWADMVCLASTEKGKGKGESNPLYKASADSTELKIMQGHWKPSIFMPRWASRITLEITEVRVERVQEITPEDCVAEGISAGGMVLAKTTMLITGTSNLKDAQDVLLKCAYRELLNSINGKKYPWESNYWVWVVSFRRINAKR